MTTATASAISASGRRKRPFGVNAIIVLSSIWAIYGLAIVAVLTFDMTARVPALVNLQVERWLMIYFVATSIIQVAIIVGLWRLKRWGWFLVMVDTGVGMILSIWAYFYAQPNYFAMAVSVLIVLYLNQRDVQQAFAEPTPFVQHPQQPEELPA